MRPSALGTAAQQHISDVCHVPHRYRSQLCNDGPKCRRKVCFFAHTIDELRVPPSKPFVAPDMLVGSPETEAAESQVRTLHMPLRGPTQGGIKKVFKMGWTLSQLLLP